MPVPGQKKYEAYMTFLDHAGRISIPKFRVSQAAYTAWLADTSTGLIHDIFAALEALSLCQEISRGVTLFNFDPNPSSVPTSEDAVNSAKLVTLMRDTVNGQPLSQQIPGRDPSKFTSSRGFVNIPPATSTAEITAYVQAMAAGALSEDGNAITVTQMKVSGRGTAP